MKNRPSESCPTRHSIIMCCLLFQIFKLRHEQKIPLQYLFLPSSAFLSGILLSSRLAYICKLRIARCCAKNILIKHQDHLSSRSNPMGYKFLWKGMSCLDSSAGLRLHAVDGSIWCKSINTGNQASQTRFMLNTLLLSSLIVLRFV